MMGNDRNCWEGTGAWQSDGDASVKRMRRSSARWFILFQDTGDGLLQCHGLSRVPGSRESCFVELGAEGRYKTLVRITIAVNDCYTSSVAQDCYYPTQSRCTLWVPLY